MHLDAASAGPGGRRINIDDIEEGEDSDRSGATIVSSGGNGWWTQAQALLPGTAPGHARRCSGSRHPALLELSALLHDECLLRAVV